MRRFAPLSLAGLLAACSGSIPPTHGRPEQGISAVLIGGRIVLPTGETLSGTMAINLEGEGGREAEVYRLRVLPDEAILYQVEPGNYHLAPTRSIFGAHEELLKVTANGRHYYAVFPREVLRKGLIAVKPTKIVSLGVLEAQISNSRLPGRENTVKVRLDDSIDTRRRLVEKTIRDMMNPSTPSDIRDSSVSWTRALEMTLSDLLAETQSSPLYKLSH